MAATDDARTAIHDTPQTYQIHLTGRLDAAWSGWFDGATIEYDTHGNTHITCVVADQAALFGLLRKIRDLGLPLQSIARIAPLQMGAHAPNQEERLKPMKMKAMTIRRYGSPDVLNYEEIDIPTPSDDQVLVKIHAASVNAADWHLMRADPPLVRLMGGGFFKPNDPVPGLDAAGVVESVGKNITRFRPGDEVFGSVNGAFAEYACTKEKNLALKPANMNFQQAAAVPTAALTALQGLRDNGGIKAGHKVLVNGAASGVGVYAIQIAKAFGAQVTGVCGPGKTDVVRACGADRVVDHSRTDVLKEDVRYDVILDNAAFRASKDYARIMTPQGAYVMVGGAFSNILKNMLAGRRSKPDRQRFTGFFATVQQDDLQTLADMITAGKVMSPIDRCFPLSQTSDAIRYMEARKVKGKIVIAVAE